MATIGYGRVSTAEQTTENQRQEIERAGHKVDYWFADEGVSGSVCALQRPQFKALLDRIRDGETLVVTKLDRLGRDAVNVMATIKILKDRSIHVVVLQLDNLDLTSPAGKLMLQMLSAVAEMERNLLIERTRAGLARAKAEGKVLGRRAKTTPAQRREMMDLYAKKTSISSLARTFNVSRATVLSVVKPSAAEAITRSVTQ